MPKFYEYSGFVFYIYSNDHEPIHCHVKKNGRSYRVKFHNIGGVILSDLELSSKLEFSDAERKKVENFLRIYADRIIEKWHLYFNGENPRCEKINKIKKGN